MGAVRDGMSGTHGAAARECRQVGDSAGTRAAVPGGQRDAWGCGARVWADGRQCTESCGGARRSAGGMGLRCGSVGKCATVPEGPGVNRLRPGRPGGGRARVPGVSGIKGCAWESRGRGRVSAGGRQRREAGVGAERLAQVSGSDRDCQSWAHRGAKGQGRAPHHSGGLRCARRVSEERRGVTEQRGAIRSESGRKRARAPTANRADALPRCGGADGHPPGLVG